MRRILLTGGGSGGHLYPLVAVAEELQARALQGAIGLDMKFIGSDGLAKELSSSIGIKNQKIIAPKWRRYASLQNFLDILKVPVAFLQSLFFVWSYMPDLIFSKGGYDSFFPVLASRIFGIPIVIHESDAIPGKANLWVNKWAVKVFIAFESAKNYFKNTNIELVGNPMRRGLSGVSERSSAVAAFSLDSSKPVVLITGASQGSQAINEALILSVVEIAKKFQIIHQCGASNFDQVKNRMLIIIKEGEASYGQTVKNNYRLYPTFDVGQMALAYSAADVIVSRSGAASLFEIAAAAKPSIVIPLKDSSSGHQLANAREFSKFGAILIEEQNLTSHILLNEINRAFENRVQISDKIRHFARVDAAANIAVKILDMFN